MPRNGPGVPASTPVRQYASTPRLQVRAGRSMHGQRIAFTGAPSLHVLPPGRRAAEDARPEARRWRAWQERRSEHGESDCSRGVRSDGTGSRGTRGRASPHMTPCAGEDTRGLGADRRALVGPPDDDESMQSGAGRRRQARCAPTRTRLKSDGTTAAGARDGVAGGQRCAPCPLSSGPGGADAVRVTECWSVRMGGAAISFAAIRAEAESLEASELRA